MTTTELCLLVITLSMAAIAVCFIFVATRLGPAIQSIQDMTREIAVLTRRLEAVGTEVETMARDLRKTQMRLNGAISLALDQVEPPLHMAAALLSGVRAGIGALVKPRKRPPEDREKGGNHE